MARKSARVPRWLKMLLALLVLCTVCWQSAKHFLDIERFRALAASEIEKRTGMPAVLGEAEMRLWPTPRVVIHGVRIGDETFGVQIVRADAEAPLGRLLRGELEVSHVTLRGVLIDVPQDAEALAARIREIQARMAGAPDDAGDISTAGATALAVTVSRIDFEDAVVRRSGVEFLAGDIVGYDVLSGTPRFAVTLRYPQASGTTVSGELRVHLGAAGPSLAGTLALASGDVWALAGIAGSPPIQATATCALSGTLPTEVALDLSGSLEAKDTPGLNGTFLAKAWWIDGQIVVNDIVFDAPALSAQADLTRSPEGELAFHVREAEFTAQGLTLAAAFSPIAQHATLGGTKASLTVSDLLGSLPTKGPIRLVHGDITFDGVDVQRGDVSLDGVSATVAIQENVISIAKAIAPGMSLGGKITPNLETNAVAFDLQATAVLSDALAGAFFPVEGLGGLGGNVDFRRIAGVWKPGLALPEGLVVQGEVAEGRAKLGFPAFQDTVSDARASFSSDGKVVKSEFSATTGQFGAVKGTANYTLASNVVDGSLTLDLARAAGPYVPEGGYADLANAVAASFGSSTLDYRVNLPSEGKQELELLAKRKGTPALDGSLRMATGTAIRIEALAAQGSVALDLVAGGLPEGMRAQGVAHVSFAAEPGLSGFNVSADLTQALVGWGDHIEKRAGDALYVRARGAKQGEAFAVTTLRVECLGEVLDLLLTDSGLEARDFALRLGALSRLFPQGATAQGTVRGSMSLAEAPAATLHLDQAALTLPQGIALEGITGEVSGRGDTWAFKNLALRGLNSDATFNGELRGKVFKADVQGKRLDGNAFLALAAFAPQASETEASPAAAPSRTARKPAPSQAAAPAATGDPFTGEATLNLGALAYRRGELSDLRAKVRMAPGSILVEDLVCRPNTGAARGTLRIDTTGAGGVHAQISFENADMALVDAMLLEEPRGLEGSATGAVDLRLTRETGHGPFSGLNGDVAFVVNSGSYGNFGIATSLLGVLRATQVLQLSRPKLGQRGLVFAESNAQVHIQDGVLRIQKFDLSEPAYALSADGYIDFPNDDMNAVVRANLFDTMTGIVAVVPGLRNTTETLRNRSAVKLTLTGSPRRPTVREEHGPRVLEGTMEGAKEVVQSTDGLVRQGIGDILRRIQR